MQPDDVAKTVAECLGRNPNEKGTKKLARALKTPLNLYLVEADTSGYDVHKGFVVRAASPLAAKLLCTKRASNSDDFAKAKVKLLGVANRRKPGIVLEDFLAG